VHWPPQQWPVVVGRSWVSSEAFAFLELFQHLLNLITANQRIFLR
jgi:hypothetical protein